jgi:5-methyltetrahydrofolate--homocysteine methyltransferase
MPRDATGSDMDVLQQISESLQRGEREKVADLTQKAIDAGTSAAQILNQGLLAGMDVVELVRSRDLQDTVKVIVGGAPLSRSFADDIGADAYGFDAANTVERIRELTGG